MSYSIYFIRFITGNRPWKRNSRKLVKDIFLFLFRYGNNSVISFYLRVEIINTITTPEYVLGALAIPLLTFSAIFDQAFQITAWNYLREKKLFTIIIIATILMSF
jgi:hypothetical protein